MAAESLVLSFERSAGAMNADPAVVFSLTLNAERDSKRLVFAVGANPGLAVGPGPTAFLLTSHSPEFTAGLANRTPLPDRAEPPAILTPTLDKSLPRDVYPLDRHVVESPLLLVADGRGNLEVITDYEEGSRHFTLDLAPVHVTPYTVLGPSGAPGAGYVISAIGLKIGVFPFVLEAPKIGPLSAYIGDGWLGSRQLALTEDGVPWGHAGALAQLKAADHQGWHHVYFTNYGPTVYGREELWERRFTTRALSQIHFPPDGSTAVLIAPGVPSHKRT